MTGAVIPASFQLLSSGAFFFPPWVFTIIMVDCNQSVTPTSLHCFYAFDVCQNCSKIHTDKSNAVSNISTKRCLKTIFQHNTLCCFCSVLQQSIVKKCIWRKGPPGKLKEKCDSEINDKMLMARSTKIRLTLNRILLQAVETGRAFITNISSLTPYHITTVWYAEQLCYFLQFCTCCLIQPTIQKNLNAA